MSLYTIIKSLQDAAGSNAKSALLEQHKDNELLKEFMRCVNSPAINFYQKKIAKHHYEGEHHEFSADTLSGMLYHLAERNITGRQAGRWLGDLFAAGTEECKMLIKCVIDKSVGAGVGDTMILKTFPGLWFSVPYQRCSLLDDKAKERFSKLSKMYVQPKLDGSFMYLVKEAGKAPQAITRAGSTYPQGFADKLAVGVPDGSVLVGEALVIEGGTVLPRQTGNGILNSILKDGPIPAHLEFSLTAWDLLTPEEFKDGKSSRPYVDRLKAMGTGALYETPNVAFIETYRVETLEEAYRIYSEHTARGEEGCVLKNPSSLWANGTSKDMVKMKISFEIDLLITAIHEGTGKASGMMGAVSVQSSEGILKADVGTGWSDDDRKYIFNNQQRILGGILTLKANDIISNRSNDTKSLFLPVAIEVRVDKFVADSYEHCVAQLNAAKNIK